MPLTGELTPYSTSSLVARASNRWQKARRQPLTMAQKIVQARMIAQAGTLTILAATAGLVATGTSQEEEDRRESVRLFVALLSASALRFREPNYLRLHMILVRPAVKYAFVLVHPFTLILVLEKLSRGK